MKGLALVLVLLCGAGMAQAQANTPTPLEAICCNCGGGVPCATADASGAWTCPTPCLPCDDCSCNPTGPTWTATATATRTNTPVSTFTATATHTATATSTNTPADGSVWSDTFGSGSTLSSSWGQWANTTPDAFDFSVSGGAAVPGGANDTIAEWKANTPNAGSNYVIIQLGSSPSSITGPMTGVDGFVDAAETPPKDGAFCLTNTTTMHVGEFDDGSAFIDGTFALGFTATTGDWVAIVRSSATDIACFVCDADGGSGCDAAGDWVATGTNVMTGHTITNPGRTGMYGSAATATIAAFCAGNGTTLPAPNTCQ